MRDEDVERVAKALHASGVEDGWDADKVWDETLPEAVREHWRRDARAAIAAYLNGDGSLMK